MKERLQEIYDLLSTPVNDVSLGATTEECQCSQCVGLRKLQEIIDDMEGAARYLVVRE